ncbi:uncharacterized protein LOC126898768 [Daktulosphaira vitifoliae]|uniref:uncharacterized protein LOC126898768 n=1 Tax=Daktulosphaira vitifoliae TaxID=58002 RepID=UPI0021A9BFDF|nr:uncharacterized protein LOC126898768 [Daktulosphaira vitifoliae]
MDDNEKFQYITKCCNKRLCDYCQGFWENNSTCVECKKTHKTDYNPILKIKMKLPCVICTQNIGKYSYDDQCNELYCKECFARAVQLSNRCGFCHTLYSKNITPIIKMF